MEMGTEVISSHTRSTSRTFYLLTYLIGDEIESCRLFFSFVGINDDIGVY